MNLEDHGDLLALTNDGSYLLLVLPLAVRSVRLFSLKVCSAQCLPAVFACLLSLSHSRLRVQKGKDGKLQVTKAKDVATKHKSDMKSICVANNNKFFLTCSESGIILFLIALGLAP
jgi:hypothetical protein